MTQQDRMLQVIWFTISASSGKIKAIISNFAECEVRRKLAEKFETFLEEGLLDPLLQYIVKDSEKDGDPKVKKALIIKILAKLRIVFYFYIHFLQ